MFGPFVGDETVALANARRPAPYKPVTPSGCAKFVIGTRHRAAERRFASVDGEAVDDRRYSRQAAPSAPVGHSDPT
jgi:hypothetical protein